MPYFTRHGTGYRFQIRVPARERAKHGSVIRIDLQTDDPKTAKVLSLRLAAAWLTKFAGADDAPGGSRPTLDSLPASPLGEVRDPSLLMAAAFAYWRDLTPNRPPRTRLDFERTAETFDAIVGKPLAALTRRDIAHFRDTLLADGLAAATVKKHLGFVSTLLQAQYDAGHVAGNVARALRVPQQKVPKPGRLGFSDEQLRAIFGSPVYTRGLRPRGGGGEAAPWLPILAYATGARLEELCQLRTEDITGSRDGEMFIRIHDDGESTRVKTESSRRVVPLHPDVQAAGFDQYVALRRERRDEWLFPALRLDAFGKRSSSWQKWWGRYLRAPSGCNINDRRVVFHSFRHTFKTLCRAPSEADASGGSTLVSEEVHDALTGHVGTTTSRHYGVVPLATLTAAIRRLKLPVPIPTIPPR